MHGRIAEVPLFFLLLTLALLTMIADYADPRLTEPSGMVVEMPLQGIALSAETQRAKCAPHVLGCGVRQP
jgi:hypothetical protein